MNTSVKKVFDMYCELMGSSSPGVFLNVPKEELRVNHQYQRPTNRGKIEKIAKEWSWIACGVIAVADRNGEYWIVDGQHRWEAALLRNDIDTLPCLIFEVESECYEAGGFLKLNTLRKPLTGTERYRAQVVSGNERAREIREFLDGYGYGIDGSGSDSRSIRCVATLMKFTDAEFSAFKRIFEAIKCAASGNPIQAQLIQGLVYIEMRMPNGESLSDSRWKDILRQRGCSVLMDAIFKAKACFISGGPKVYARGILNAINYKLKNPLRISATESD